jgi:hypothetical protein
MNKHSKILILTLMLVSALAIAACGSTPAVNSNGTAAAAQPAAAATTAPASSSSSCPVGVWSLTDFSSYMNSIQQNTASASGSDVTIASQAFTGTAKFDFGADGTATLMADNFQQKFIMTTDAGGTKLNIDIALNINGKSTAKYTVADDKISFTDQDNSGMTISVDTMGTNSPIDQNLLGQSGTIQLYQFACPDATTLTLKVIATKTDLAPLTLTRAQ